MLCSPCTSYWLGVIDMSTTLLFILRREGWNLVRLAGWSRGLQLVAARRHPGWGCGCHSARADSSTASGSPCGRWSYCRCQTVAVCPQRVRVSPCLLALGGLLGIFQRKEDEEEEGAVPSSVKRQLLKAQRSLRKGDYPSAERAYHQALKLLALSDYAQSQPFLEARAVCMDKLANMYLEQGKLDEAEANFRETLRVMISAGVNKEDDAVVGISLKLAKIYTNQKKYDLASSGFHWCVQTAEKNWKDSATDERLALWGMCLHSKGQYHLASGEGTEAEAALHEALRIAELVYGPSHLQVAVLHNDLATSLDRLDQCIDAEAHVKQSLEIAGALRGQDVAEHTAIFYYNLAVILTHQGKPSSAMEAYSKALKEAKKLRDKTLHHHLQHKRN